MKCKIFPAPRDLCPTVRPDAGRIGTMAFQSAAEPVLLDTGAGRFAGVREHGVLRVRGIRYAVAGRFERPRAATPEPGTTPATEPAPACRQPMSRGDRMLGEPYRGIRFDEDCLRLSVTAPDDLARDERVP